MLSKPGLVLQHGDDGPPARFGDWLRERGLEFVVHPAWEQPPPDPGEFAFVASLGSESSAGEIDGWVADEIAALGAAVEADVPVLGLCFGGQALSVALGGGIDVLPTPEIGWVPVQSSDPLVPGTHWLQYHFDLMHLPPGAEALAHSPAGLAAFRHGRHLGLQFHPEVDADLVDLWARTDPKLPSTGITAEDLAAQSRQYAQAARSHAFALFDAWLAGLVAAPAGGRT